MRWTSARFVIALWKNPPRLYNAVLRVLILFLVLAIVHLARQNPAEGWVDLIPPLVLIVLALLVLHFGRERAE